MSDIRRFVVEISTEIAASDEGVAASIKKGVDEFVTLFSLVKPLVRDESNEEIIAQKDHQLAEQERAIVLHAEWRNSIEHRMNSLTTALQTAHDHMHRMMLQMNEMQNAPHMKVLNELADYLVER